MDGYIGETVVSKFNTPFAKYQRIDFIQEWINMYSYIDGSHHKQWLIDQIARISLGTPVIIKLARWENGKEEYRLTLGEPTSEYLEWIGNDIEEFSGIAP